MGRDGTLLIGDMNTDVWTRSSVIATASKALQSTMTVDGDNTIYRVGTDAVDSRIHVTYSKDDGVSFTEVDIDSGTYPNAAFIGEYDRGGHGFTWRVVSFITPTEIPESGIKVKTSQSRSRKTPAFFVAVGGQINNVKSCLSSVIISIFWKFFPIIGMKQIEKSLQQPGPGSVVSQQDDQRPFKF